jgi:group I intron endonuclease
MIGIYKITSPTNKVYIGQSVDIERRFNGYKKMYSRNKSQIKLHRSFLKHGVDKHKFEILCECEIFELNEKERYYQDLYSVLEIGLNCRLTKTNDRSGKSSKETIEKLKNRVVSVETRAKISAKTKGKQIGIENPFYGKKHSSETKFKISIANKGRIAYNKDKKHSEETIKKISLKSQGNNYCLGRILSQETKNKISKSLCKKVINIKTGEIFNSYKELAEKLKISHNTLNKKLNGNTENNTEYRYL